MIVKNKSFFVALLILLALVCGMVQAIWPSTNMVFFAKPDFLLVLVVGVSYWFVPAISYWFSLGAGLLTDYFGGDVLLISALRLFMISILVTYLSTGVSSKNTLQFIKQMLLAYFASAVFCFFQAILTVLFQGKPLQVFEYVKHFATGLPLGVLCQCVAMIFGVLVFRFVFGFGKNNHDASVTFSDGDGDTLDVV